MTIIDYLVTAVLTEAISLLPLYLALKLGKNPLRKYIRGAIIPEIDKYLGEMLSNLEKNPAVLRPLINAFMKELSSGSSGGEGGAITFKAPFIGKVSVPKEIAGWLMKKMGVGGGNGSETKNPLD